VLVQRLGDELLAGAGFAGDEDGDDALREPANGTEDVLHRRRLAEHLGHLRRRGVAHLLAQAFLHGAADQLDGLGHVEGFRQVVEGAALERAHRAVEVGVRRS
jgi:hypothetical protein